jgi:hypothetical protein
MEQQGDEHGHDIEMVNIFETRKKLTKAVEKGKSKNKGKERKRQSMNPVSSGWTVSSILS